MKVRYEMNPKHGPYCVCSNCQDEAHEKIARRANGKRNCCKDLALDTAPTRRGQIYRTEVNK